jgi:hypothetical protein
MSIQSPHPSELLGSYARGELDEARSREVEDHLESCEQCRTELTAVRALREAEPPPLTETQRASIRRSVATSTTATPPRRNLGMIVGIAAVVAVIAVGFLYVGLTGGGSGEGMASGSGASGERLQAVQNHSLSHVAFDRSAGTFTTSSVRKLVQQKFLPAATQAKGGSEPYDAIPGPSVPANKTHEVFACARQVTSAGGNSPILVYAGSGKDTKGRPATGLGFVYSASKRSRPDHYAFWVWRNGRCASTPELYLSGKLGH